MAQSEIMEYQGYRLRAMKSPGGDWVGQASVDGIPQLAAESRDDLYRQFRIVVDTVTDAEAGLEEPDEPDPRFAATRGFYADTLPDSLEARYGSSPATGRLK